MLTAVYDYLKPRIDRDTIMIVQEPIAADALQMLALGFVWDVTYDAGRLLAVVDVSDLLEGGQHDLVVQWLRSKQETNTPLYQQLLGMPVSAAQRDALSFDDRLDLARAQIGAGGTVSPAEFDALATRAERDLDRHLLAHVQRSMHGDPPPEDPARPLGQRKGVVSTLDFMWSGDLAGCVAWFEEDVREARARETSINDWVRLARMCRFLTGDDARAMGFLEQHRFWDVHEEWIEVFGDAGRARVQAEKDEVLGIIEAAFDGVPFPGPQHRSLFQAEAADHYAGCDQSRDHKGRWQDLPREHILACQWALPHLRRGSIPYYLPALMSFVVREHDLQREDHGSEWIFDSVRYHFDWSETASGLAYAEKRHRDLNREQLAAIVRFIEYYGSKRAVVERWRKIAENGEWPKYSP